MSAFDKYSTSEDVVRTFASQAQGRTIVITGAGQPSIGSSMATILAQASPEHIVIASRTASKVESVLAQIQTINPAVKATFVHVDLSDHESVRTAADKILAATNSKIDLLINSAGIMAVRNYAVDKQGIEIQFSANHVGHFLLTNLLMPALLAAAAQDEDRGARIVNLSSLGYRISPVRFEDYNFSGGEAYDMWSAYGQSKTANILFAYGITKRLKDKGITAFAVHPGSNHDTELGSHLGMEDYNKIPAITKRNVGTDWEFDDPRFKTFDQIGATPLAAALDPTFPGKSSCYVANCQVEEPEEMARAPENVEQLWKLSENLVGQEFSY
ncbi:short-chain dehydrogenase [Fusarium longipes]|uniref:Short-chain dehydrogenase n=1 Tax=Fusarium longipes TaxID=694270 RepID=A0A395TAJ5_9HYPO|nr:short-chain dehydrogenase [Fusarium longipes]